MKIGIIGGTGLDNPQLLDDFKEISVDTPFGKPSSTLIKGKYQGIDLVIIARHGRKHEIPPTQVNNKANIFALKNEGCKYILATSAVGSLKEEIQRGDFVILDQFIDFTRRRDLSFYDRFDFGALHMSMAKPFSELLRKKLIESCRTNHYPVHSHGTVVTIEGPRFSTIAESRMFRAWGADVINMSIAPEAILANEAEVPYAVIAISTDYDCWKQDEEPVSWDAITEIFKKNMHKVQNILLDVVSSFARERVLEKLSEKIRVIENHPQPGVSFKDITPLLKDRDAYKQVIDLIVDAYKEEKIDYIAGIESRGFILAGSLAEKLGCGFIPIRKKGKLPHTTLQQEYALEYGSDVIEMHQDAVNRGEKVLVVDDLIATGGTAEAACQVIEKLKGEGIGCAVLINLSFLPGKKNLESRG